jgi:ribosomal protein S12 methylthiotransferase
MMPITVGLVSLGCSKNQVDAERFLADLEGQGFAFSADPAECDAVIVNTCGFIEDAKAESIEAILEMCALKERGGPRVVAVTGCLAERYGSLFAEEIPEADVVLGIGSNHMLGEAIKKALAGKGTYLKGERTNLSLEGPRTLLTPPYTAYLKLADGCDNCCTYCAIPLIRGRFRSRRMEDVLAEAVQLVEGGARELNLIAQDTTRYGEDIYGRLMLPELIDALCEIEGLVWLRLLYCYPDRVTDQLIDTMARQPKVVKYIDLPLQHISTAVLSGMNRPMGSEEIRALLKKIRTRIPGVVVRTTFIAGLPGEGEQEFAELCDFIREQRFERLGCFAFSPEEDTPAFTMDYPDAQQRSRRADHIMQLQQPIAEEIGRAMIGRTLTVLCEGYDPEVSAYVGRSYMDAPDVDTRVYFKSGSPVEPGRFIQVCVTAAEGYDLWGQPEVEV